MKPAKILPSKALIPGDHGRALWQPRFNGARLCTRGYRRYIAHFVVSLLLTLLVQAANAVTYYVSPAGNDTNGLSESTAFRTIQQAANKTLPGDTVLVMNGAYRNTWPGSDIVTIRRSGSQQGGYITYQAYPGHKPLIVVAKNNWNGFKVLASYIVIEGFTIDGAAEDITYRYAYSQRYIANPATNANCVNADGRQVGATIHHIIVRGNKIFQCPGAGIVAIAADYVTIRANVVHSTSWWSKYGTSGISIYGSRNVDFADGYKNVIWGNISYNNRNHIPWEKGTEVTDGNGIIIDDNMNTQQQNVPAYQGQSLVINNLVYGNGGRGINIFSSARVDVVNNTSYLNAGSADIDSDVMCRRGFRVRFLNNIFVARGGKRVTSVFDCAASVFDYNVYYNGRVAVIGRHDIVGNPRFRRVPANMINPDFRLLRSSPATDSGTGLLAQASDIVGTARPRGEGYDRGAYESW